MGFRCTGCPCIATPATTTGLIDPFVIDSWAQGFASGQELGIDRNPSGINALPVNRAYYSLFQVHEAAGFPIAAVAWTNGPIAGNVDMGVYDTAGNRLASIGSTPQAGANAIQITALVHTLAPGNYYLAMATDNAGGQYLTIAPPSAGMGNVVKQDAAFPLPAAAAFATLTNATSLVPVMAISRRTGF